MGLGLWLGLALIALTFALKLSDALRPPDSWNALLVLAVLGGLAWAAPNPWVAAVLVLVAANAVVVQATFRSGTELFAPLNAILGAQIAVAIWAGGYVGLARSGRLTPVTIQTVAAVTVGWATFNALAAGWSRVRGGLPGRKDVPAVGWIDPILPESAYVGTNHMLAWLCGLGILSAAYLGSLWVLTIPLIAMGSLISRNISGLAAGGAALTAYATARWGPVAFAVAAVPTVAGVFVLGHRLDFQQLQLRRVFWRSLLSHVRVNGRGMGYLATYRFRLSGENGLRALAWDWAHNEWLQGAVELGPLASLCAAGYVVTHALTLPPTPEAAYGFALVILTAVYGLVYFPLHMAGQSWPLLIGMAVLDRT